MIIFAAFIAGFAMGSLWEERAWRRYKATQHIINGRWKEWLTYGRDDGEA